MCVCERVSSLMYIFVFVRPVNTTMVNSLFSSCHSGCSYDLTR